MTSVKHDDNFVVCGMGVSSVDGVTPVALTLDPATGRLRVKVVGFGGGLANNPVTSFQREENRIPIGHSEDMTNVTLVPATINLDNNGVLLL